MDIITTILNEIALYLNNNTEFQNTSLNYFGQECKIFIGHTELKNLEPPLILMSLVNTNKTKKSYILTINMILIIKYSKDNINYNLIYKSEKYQQINNLINILLKELRKRELLNKIKSKIIDLIGQEGEIEGFEDHFTYLLTLKLETRL